MPPANLKELEALQRDCHNIEANRRSFAEESQLTLRKQQKTLEKLRKEKETLKNDIANFQANFSLKPMSSSEQAGVTKLFSEIARYNELAEADRRLIRSMGEKISQLSERIGRQRKNMGGVNAARENQRTVEKHVRLLENRVDQALLKFNKSLAQNRNLRQEIDDLRGERGVFQEVHKKLERELRDQKKRMANVIEQSNAAYEHRDKAQLETVAIEQADRKEQDFFEHQMLEAGKMLDDELQLSAANRPVDVSSEILSRDGPRLNTERPIQHVIHPNAIREQAQEIEAQIQHFERAFHDIEVASGIFDTDELVQKFLVNDEYNFSLYTYVNEQSNEIKRLTELQQKLCEEESKSAADNKKMEDAQERLNNELRCKIEANEKQFEKFSLRFETDQTVLNGLKSAIHTLFYKLQCKSDIPVEISMTESNMFHFLGIIEERTNEIISIHNTMKSLEKSSGYEMSYEEDLRENDTISPISQHLPRARSSFSKHANQTSGPVAPMGADQIYVNPPKLTDCSSDDDSADDAVCTYPLTRDEIRNKSEARANRLVAARSSGEYSKSGNYGRRGSLLAFHERKGRKSSIMPVMGHDAASSFRVSSLGQR